MFTCINYVLHRRRRTCCFNSLFTWTGTGMGWCENSTRWKSHKPVWARTHGAWACLAHGLQCLCDERVLPSPCPATRNLSFLSVSPAPSHCCFKLLCHWDVHVLDPCSVSSVTNTVLQHVQKQMEENVGTSTQKEKINMSKHIVHSLERQIMIITMACTLPIPRLMVYRWDHLKPNTNP